MDKLTKAIEKADKEHHKELRKQVENEQAKRAKIEQETRAVLLDIFGDLGGFTVDEDSATFEHENELLTITVYLNSRTLRIGKPCPDCTGKIWSYIISYQTEEALDRIGKALYFFDTNHENHHCLAPYEMEEWVIESVTSQDGTVYTLNADNPDVLVLDIGEYGEGTYGVKIDEQTRKRLYDVKEVSYILVTHTVTPTEEY